MKCPCVSQAQQETTQAGTKNKMSTALTGLLSSLLILILLASASDGGEEVLEKQWCIADEQTPDDVLQAALDWACGPGGADCRMIQPNKPCYLPNTVKAHASYAFNSYWQKTKNQGGSCYFSAAAMVTDLNPSHGACQYESLP